MKKKISLVVAVLVLVLGLAGCGNAKTVSYDKDTLIQSCDAVFDIIESGSITSDQITEMSDWNQGYLMAQFENQTGVQMEADTFATALEGWKASLEECGDYESHKDYEFEASSTGVTVTAPATFSDRNADLEFVFDENMTLESFTVNAHYGMSEILEKAGLNTLLGMGTVFVMLIFMSFIISLIKYVPALLNGTSKKKKEEAPKAAPAAAPRRRFLATIKSASAPQTPRGDFGVILQGPMLQIRQQVPLKPKVHCGCCLSKRSNAVSYPSCSIRSIISFTAGSGTLSSTSCLVGKVLR